MSGTRSKRTWIESTTAVQLLGLELESVWEKTPVMVSMSTFVCNLRKRKAFRSCVGQVACSYV